MRFLIVIDPFVPRSLLRSALGEMGLTFLAAADVMNGVGVPAVTDQQSSMKGAESHALRTSTLPAMTAIELSAEYEAIDIEKTITDDPGLHVLYLYADPNRVAASAMDQGRDPVPDLASWFGAIQQFLKAYNEQNARARILEVHDLLASPGHYSSVLNASFSLSLKTEVTSKLYSQPFNLPAGTIGFREWCREKAKRKLKVDELEVSTLGRASPLLFDGPLAAPYFKHVAKLNRQKSSARSDYARVKAELDSEKADLDRAITVLHGLQRDHEQVLDEKEMLLGNANKAHKKIRWLREKKNELGQQLVRSERRMKQLVSSTSWRVTLPLRAVKLILFRPKQAIARIRRRFSPK